MPLNMVSMAVYVTLEGKIPRTPISDSSITDGNASCRQQFFDVTEAKCKSVIKPHSVTDNLRWIAISGINIGIFHALIIACF